MSLSTSLSKTVLQAGNASACPTKGDEVTVEYTGWLYDTKSTDPYHRGKE
jgi:FKBP-type peptidyl-prolyl cis-trans isomerase